MVSAEAVSWLLADSRGKQVEDSPSRSGSLFISLGEGWQLLRLRHDWACLAVQPLVPGCLPPGDEGLFPRQWTTLAGSVLNRILGISKTYCFLDCQDAGEGMSLNLFSPGLHFIFLLAVTWYCRPAFLLLDSSHFPLLTCSSAVSWKRTASNSLKMNV